MPLSKQNRYVNRRIVDGKQHIPHTIQTLAKTVFGAGEYTSIFAKYITTWQDGHGITIEIEYRSIYKQKLECLIMD